MADRTRRILPGILSKTYDPNQKTTSAGLNANDLAFVSFSPAKPHFLSAKISYKIEGVPISYTTTFELMPDNNMPPLSITRFPLRGTVTEDYADSYSTGVVLKTGQVLGVEMKGKHALFLLAGSEYLFNISAGSMWAHNVTKVKSLTPRFRIAKITGIDGFSRQDVAKLTDLDPATHVKINPGKQTFIVHLAKEETISAARILFPVNPAWWIQGKDYSFEAKVDGKWLSLGLGNLPVMRPVIPRKTKEIRLTLDVDKERAILQELNFIIEGEQTTGFQATW